MAEILSNYMWRYLLRKQEFTSTGNNKIIVHWSNDFTPLGIEVKCFAVWAKSDFDIFKWFGHSLEVYTAEEDQENTGVESGRFAEIASQMERLMMNAERFADDNGVVYYWPDCSVNLEDTSEKVSKFEDALEENGASDRQEERELGGQMVNDDFSRFDEFVKDEDEDEDKEDDGD